MRYRLLFLILLFTSGRASAQQAGYKNLILTDSARRYKQRAHPGDRFFFRPVELDLWYPAHAVNALPMQYGDFLRLFQDRANRFQDDTVFANLAGTLTQSICAGLGIGDSSSLTDFPTQTFKGANTQTGQFPLILYLCAYNGMCYENTSLFEALAQRGYIVASITSVGRYPGDMTTDSADLNQQILDAVFAFNKLKSWPAVDSSRLGLIGYSWGGPAALLLADKVHSSAMLSLDGSEMHYYGRSPEEDRSFDKIRPAIAEMEKPGFPYAYLESGGKINDGPLDSLFNPVRGWQMERKYLRFLEASHEDFSSLPGIAMQIKKDPSSASQPDFKAFALTWFDHFLKGSNKQLPPDSPYPVIQPASASSQLKGVIRDAEDMKPVPYVNIGIPGKNVGTVSLEDGSFQLKVGQENKKDSILFSMAGYGSLLMPESKIIPVILLKRKKTQLNEVVITKYRPERKIYGNLTKSRTVAVGFPMRFTGAEIGVKVSLGKKLRRLTAFNCHVTNTRVDSAIFRLNIYRVEKGEIENILTRNILLTIRQAPSAYSIDLDSLNLHLSGEILFSLELLRSYSSTAESGAVFFSAAFFNSGTWRRQISQAKWKKSSGIGVGFNIETR